MKLTFAFMALIIAAAFSEESCSYTSALAACKAERGAFGYTCEPYGDCTNAAPACDCSCHVGKDVEDPVTKIVIGPVAYANPITKLPQETEGGWKGPGVPEQPPEGTKIDELGLVGSSSAAFAAWLRTAAGVTEQTMCILDLCGAFTMIPPHGYKDWKKCDLDGGGKCPCGTKSSSQVVDCCNASTEEKEKEQEKEKEKAPAPAVNSTVQPTCEDNPKYEDPVYGGTCAAWAGYECSYDEAKDAAAAKEQQQHTELLKTNCCKTCAANAADAGDDDDDDDDDEDVPDADDGTRRAGPNRKRKTMHRFI